MAKRTIEELNKVIEQAQKQKETILQKLKNQEREQSTRQKIILGGWILANDLELVEKVKEGLTRDQDRIAFGLSVLVKKTDVTQEAGQILQENVPH